MPKGNDAVQIAVLDTETTGLSREDQLIELGAVRLHLSPDTGALLGEPLRFHALREPSCPINPGAQRVHGLTLKHLKGQQIPAEAFGQFMDGVDAVIGHNASFDRRFVSQLFPWTLDLSWYCSQRGISWDLYGHTSKKLDYLLTRHGITLGGHRALSDAEALSQLLISMSPKGKPYISELLSRKPMRAYTPGTAAPPARAPTTITISMDDIDRVARKEKTKRWRLPQLTLRYRIILWLIALYIALDVMFRMIQP